MKKLLLIAMITPMFAFAQDEQDYAQLFGKFVQYYNKKQPDSICTLFPDVRTTGNKCPWAAFTTDGTFDVLGKLKTYKYFGKEGSGDREVTMYKAIFSKKGVQVVSFHVDGNQKFTIFLVENP